jgi:hypothetical protein
VDQLYPEESPFTQAKWHAAYQMAVCELLCPDDNGRHIASVVCLPSFENEWAVCIRESQHMGCSATLTTADEQISANLELGGKLPSVTKVSVPLSQTMAGLIADVWKRMLRTVSYKIRGPTGLDGVSYHFWMHQSVQGPMSGYTWSPRPETASGRLVVFSETLRGYILAPESKRATLGRRIEEQSAWFQSMPVRTPPDQATLNLQKAIRTLVDFYQREMYSECELAALLADAFASASYPPLDELLETLELIPENLRNRLREL